MKKGRSDTRVVRHVYVPEAFTRSAAPLSEDAISANYNFNEQATLLHLHGRLTFALWWHVVFVRRFQVVLFEPKMKTNPGERFNVEHGSSKKSWVCISTTEEVEKEF